MERCILSNWNSNQYLKFKKERTQPAYDLVNRIDFNNPQKIIDVGCGPGNSTQVLSERFPNAEILGIDNSENMIASAKSAYPNLNFLLCDAGKDLASINQKFDIVFSNACIQWIPDHRKLLKNMMDLLNENGVLAIQTPMNYDEPIHKIISFISSSGKWKEKFNSPRIMYNLTSSEYYDLLSEISADFSMWNTTYFHRMKSYESIIEWHRGTGLRPYLDALCDRDKEKFENEVYHQIIKEYPKQKNGEIIFKFPRLFFTAIK